MDALKMIIGIALIIAFLVGGIVCIVCIHLLAEAIENVYNQYSVGDWFDSQNLIVGTE